MSAAGGCESELLEPVQRMADRLRSRGYPGLAVVTRVYEGEGHASAQAAASWALRGREAKLTHVPEEDRPGYWYLFVLAQDVNTVLQGTEPFEAAHTIGGFVLTSQLELNFDEPCQLQHDAVVHVI